MTVNKKKIKSDCLSVFHSPRPGELLASLAVPRYARQAPAVPPCVHYCTVYPLRATPPEFTEKAQC